MDAEKITCMKCGGDCKVEGMAAENSKMPGFEIRMIRCTCEKCGFMDIRMDGEAFSKLLTKKPEEN